MYNMIHEHISLAPPNFSTFHMMKMDSSMILSYWEHMGLGTKLIQN